MTARATTTSAVAPNFVQIADGFIVVNVVSILVAAAAGLLTTVVYLIWSRLKDSDSWRNLNQAEYNEFFHGGAVDGDEVLYPSAWTLPYDISYELTDADLRITSNIIGQGQFSKVYLGHLRRVAWTSNKVAVKANKPYLSMLEFKAALYEVKLLISLGDHDNIVKLIGAKTSHVRQRQIFTVLEYCEFGDLGEHLRTNRQELISSFLGGRSAAAVGSFTGYVSQMELMFGAGNPTQLIRWTLQILNALLFLGRHRVVHGDLAAKNVLLDSRRTAKLCDFGMAHQLSREQSYVYLGSPHTKKPCNSSAPESLDPQQCLYSIKSDVYSFGVVLWEMFTLGETPWAGVDCCDLLNRLSHEECLQMPRVTTSHAEGNEITLITASMYQKMKECWRLDPNTRPSFEDLRGFFSILVTDPQL